MEVLKENGMAIAATESASVAREQSGSRQRVQLDFSNEAYNRLKQLRERSDARTNAELVRNALRLYEWYLNTKDERYRIHLVRDNEVKEVEIIF